MKIPLNILNEILETISQNVCVGTFRENRDKRYKFTLPPAPSEFKDTYYYQEVVVYFDCQEGWVLDTKEQSE